MIGTDYPDQFIVENAIRIKEEIKAKQADLDALKPKLAAIMTPTNWWNEEAVFMPDFDPEFVDTVMRNHKIMAEFSGNDQARYDEAQTAIDEALRTGQYDAQVIQDNRKAEGRAVTAQEARREVYNHLGEFIHYEYYPRPTAAVKVFYTPDKATLRKDGSPLETIYTARDTLNVSVTVNAATGVVTYANATTKQMGHLSLALDTGIPRVPFGYMVSPTKNFDESEYRRFFISKIPDHPTDTGLLQVADYRGVAIPT